MLLGLTKHYFENTGFLHDYRAHMITLEMFTKVFYVLGFDLTPDIQADEEHKIMLREGNGRIDALFNKPLLEPMTCLFYADVPGHFEIDHSRNFTVE